MTEQETQQVKDTALARCIRFKRNVNLANEALNQTADAMESVARVLRSPQRSGFVFDSRAWLNPEALYRLIVEADKAQEDYADAQMVAASLGEAI
jgi:hypothetical protein